MNTCPYCTATSKQRKIGRTTAGSQRYQCQQCGRRYTPEPKTPGYDDDIRLQAVRLYADGMNFRRIGRQLGVSHQSVINWVNAYSAQLPARPPGPEVAGVVEMDELFSFIGEKKTGLPDDAGGSP
jgi:transposase-like protein